MDDAGLLERGYSIGFEVHGTARDPVDGRDLEPDHRLHARESGLRQLLHRADPAVPDGKAAASRSIGQDEHDRRHASTPSGSTSRSAGRSRAASSSARSPTSSTTTYPTATSPSLRHDAPGAAAHLPGAHEAARASARPHPRALLLRRRVRDQRLPQATARRCRTSGWACRSRTPATRGAPTCSARSRPRSGSSAPSRSSARSSRAQGAVKCPTGVACTGCRYCETARELIERPARPDRHRLGHHRRRVRPRRAAVPPRARPRDHRRRLRHLETRAIHMVALPDETRTRRRLCTSSGSTLSAPAALSSASGGCAT
jgi:hypothetical protein